MCFYKIVYYNVRKYYLHFFFTQMLFINKSFIFKKLKKGFLIFFGVIKIFKT